MREITVLQMVSVSGEITVDRKLRGDYDRNLKIFQLFWELPDMRVLHHLPRRLE